MQIKLFTISILDNDLGNEALNKFLRSHKILDIKQDFYAGQNGAYWCFTIKYINSKERDVRQINRLFSCSHFKRDK